MWFLMELSSIGPAFSSLGSDSSRGAEVEAGGLSPLAPLTLTTVDSLPKTLGIVREGRD